MPSRSFIRDSMTESIVSNAPTLTKLLKAFFLQKPPTKNLLPSWSLPCILRALAKGPFESLMNLTIKTAFLLAVASGQRRSIPFTCFRWHLVISAGRTDSNLSLPLRPWPSISPCLLNQWNYSSSPLLPFRRMTKYGVLSGHLIGI